MASSNQPLRLGWRTIHTIQQTLNLAQGLAHGESEQNSATQVCPMLLPPAQVDKTSVTKRMVPVDEDLIIKLKGLLAHKAPGISDENLIDMGPSGVYKKT